MNKVKPNLHIIKNNRLMFYLWTYLQARKGKFKLKIHYVVCINIINIKFCKDRASCTTKNKVIKVKKSLKRKISKCTSIVEIYFKTILI